MGSGRASRIAAGSSYNGAGQVSVYNANDAKQIAKIEIPEGGIFAVDFSADGKRDLWNSLPDIIGSVANYFRVHGWQLGEPVATPARITGDDYQTVLKLGYKPNTVLDALRHDGITPVGEYPDHMVAALISFEQEHGPEYWLGFNNFYTITRYNHSPLYAMAVYQLSEEIRAAYEAGTDE